MGAAFRKPLVEPTRTSKICTAEDLRAVIRKVVRKKHILTSSDEDDIIALLANDDEDICKNSLEVIEEELSCRVCISLVKQAQSISCGHIFCRNCIQRWKDSKTFCTSTCPICRTWFRRISKFPKLDEIFELVIKHSEVYKQQKIRDIQDIAHKAYELHGLDFLDSHHFPMLQLVTIGPVRLIRETENDRINFHVNVDACLRLL